MIMYYCPSSSYTVQNLQGYDDDDDDDYYYYYHNYFQHDNCYFCFVPYVIVENTFV